MGQLEDILQIHLIVTTFIMLRNVDLGNVQTIKFVDVVTNANVSVSPITCLIECEEVIEDETGTKKA